MSVAQLQLHIKLLLLVLVVTIQINAGPIEVPSSNNLEVGSCDRADQRIYTDNTIVENGGPSTLNGTLEVSYEVNIYIFFQIASLHYMFTDLHRSAGQNHLRSH